MFTCFITYQKKKKNIPLFFFFFFLSNLKSQFGQAVLQSEHMTWQEKGWCYGFFHLLEFRRVKGQLSQEAGSVPRGPRCLEKFSWRQDASAQFHSTAPNCPGAWMHFCIYGATLSVLDTHVLIPLCVCVCVFVSVSEWKRCSHKTVRYQHSNGPWWTVMKGDNHPWHHYWMMTWSYTLYISVLWGIIHVTVASTLITTSIKA